VTEPAEGTVAWRTLLAEATDALAAAGVDAAASEARWMVEEASGLEGADWVLGLDEPATVGGVARLDAMVARRVGGEPIQYVLGHWAFRRLDLLVDRRVLIPRPETEQVVEVALAELDRVVLGRPAGHRPVVVDLGTGSGAIALAIASERPGTEVWATERSADALAVARANLAGLGMAGMSVRLAEGSWFEGLPASLLGRVDLVVSNPPYVAATDALPASVTDWEPAEALVPGPTGLEAYDEILSDAHRWVAGGGAFVAEIGVSQGPDVARRLEAAGWVEPHVEPDLRGLPRAVVARRAGSYR
jgi:release factor glutamine methyltransferase